MVLNRHDLVFSSTFLVHLHTSPICRNARASSLEILQVQAIRRYSRNSRLNNVNRKLQGITMAGTTPPSFPAMFSFCRRWKKRTMVIHCKYVLAVPVKGSPHDCHSIASLLQLLEGKKQPFLARWQELPHCLPC